jgi:nitrite reductase (NADH) large subunit
MYYVRTADRLERTATWLDKLEGGIDHVREVVLDDALGLLPDLDADMARHVSTYECEWKATLDDPVRLARFRSFTNSDDADPDLTFVRVRGQRQPA